MVTDRNLCIKSFILYAARIKSFIRNTELLTKIPYDIMEWGVLSWLRRSGIVTLLSHCKAVAFRYSEALIRATVAAGRALFTHSPRPPGYRVDNMVVFAVAIARRVYCKFQISLKIKCSYLFSMLSITIVSPSLDH